MSRALACALLAVALGGCRTLPAGPVPGPDLAACAAIAAVADWHATGRVAVRTASDGLSASFDWRETAGRGELGVRGPLGAGAVRIERSAERIVIDSGRGAPVEVPAPFDALEPELVARLGFALPLEPLRYWVLGVPAPGLPVDGAAPDFSQAGWRIAVTEFVAVAGSPGPLPARLTLSRAGTRIRVIVDRWQVGA